MRIRRANPSWAARFTFAVLGAAAIAATFFCLEATARGAACPEVRPVLSIVR